MLVYHPPCKAGSSCAQACACTGYMFRSAMYRLELRNSLSVGDTAGSLADIQEAAPPAAIGAEEAVFAPGTQKLRVEGEVLRWHLASDSAETIPALDYIHMLERENDALKRQVRNRAPPSNAASIHSLTCLTVAVCMYFIRP